MRYKPKIFEKYIYKEHAKILALVLVSLSVVYTLIAFLDIVDDAIENKVPVYYAFIAALYRLPSGLKELGAIAILLSTILFMAISSKNLEPVILRSLGIKLKVFLKPLVVEAAVLSILLGINAMFIAPPLFSKYIDTVEIKIKGKKKKRRTKPVKMWIKNEGFTCYIGYFSGRKKSISNLKCFKSENGTTTIIFANKAFWTKGKWKAYRVQMWKIRGVSTFKKKWVVYLKFLPPPYEIMGRKKVLEEMNLEELVAVVKELNREGIRNTRYLQELCNRLFLSLFPIIIVILAFPLGISEPRKGQVATAFVKGIFMALLVYGIYFSFAFAGKAGIINPVIASSIPVAGLTAFGLRLVNRIDT